MENQQILHDIEEVVDVEPGTLRGNEKPRISRIGILSRFQFSGNG